VENINGTFILINRPWNSQLFAVDQSGNAEVEGKLKADGALGSGFVSAVSLATLKKYNTGLTAVGSDASQIAYSVSACNRYCGSGCTAANSYCNQWGATPAAGNAGLGYHGGTAVEWDSLDKTIECACF